MSLSHYKIKHLMVMAYGKLITLEDQRRLGITAPCVARRSAFLFNRTAKEERQRLEGLKLSKRMLVFEITDAQFGMCGIEGHTWEHCAERPRSNYEPMTFLMPKPTKVQWGKSFEIGKDGGAR